MFTQHDGGQRAGNDLRDLLERARVQRRQMLPLYAKVGNLDIVEQAAIAGALVRATPRMPPRRRSAPPNGSIMIGQPQDGLWLGEANATARFDLQPHQARRRRAPPGRGDV